MIVGRFKNSLIGRIYNSNSSLQSSKFSFLMTLETFSIFVWRKASNFSSLSVLESTKLSECPKTSRENFSAREFLREGFRVL